LAREPEPAHVAAPADLEGLPAPEAPTAKQQVAIVLARQREPLLAREVQELIEGYFPVGTVPTIAEVRSVLSEGRSRSGPNGTAGSSGEKPGRGGQGNGWRGELRCH
jgi:hypothetical protein